MNLLLFATEQSGGGRGGGMDSHKSDEDAHHFDLGCKLQILVSQCLGWKVTIFAHSGIT